jgi:hypothetical protein
LLQICFIFVALFGVVICVLVSHTTDLTGASIWDFNAGQRFECYTFISTISSLSHLQAFTPLVRLSLVRPRPSSPGKYGFVKSH